MGNIGYMRDAQKNEIDSTTPDFMAVFAGNTSVTLKNVWIYGKNFHESLMRMELNADSISESETACLRRKCPEARIYFGNGSGFFPRKCLIIDGVDFRRYQKIK